jgi:ferrous iron transport protein B
MGLDWQAMVALLTSVVRKENTIPTLAVLYGAGTAGMGLGDIVGHHLSPAAALAFLVVQILFIPCVATVSTLHQETRSWRWTLFSVAILFVISMGIGILIYQGAVSIGWGV